MKKYTAVPFVYDWQQRFADYKNNSFYEEIYSDLYTMYMSKYKDSLQAAKKDPLTLLIIIGIPGSGKSTLAKHAQSYGFLEFASNDIYALLEAKIKELGEEHALEVFPNPYVIYFYKLRLVKEMFAKGYSIILDSATHPDFDDLHVLTQKYDAKFKAVKISLEDWKTAYMRKHPPIKQAKKLSEFPNYKLHLKRGTDYMDIKNFAETFPDDWAQHTYGELMEGQFTRFQTTMKKVEIPDYVDAKLYLKGEDSIEHNIKEFDKWFTQ